MPRMRMQSMCRQAHTIMAQSIACICTCQSTCAPRPHHECLSFLFAAASQHCVPGLHRVQAILHVLNDLSHHGRHIL